MQHLSRRTFLVITGGAAAGGLAACGGGNDGRSIIAASDEAVERRERARAGAGAPVVRPNLAASPRQLDLAGRVVNTWGYSEPLLRATAGDLLEVQLINELPEVTTIHWHGLALRNDMDGMQSLTQRPVTSGERFTYRFVVPHSGTYFFHPHTGLQLDRALHAPLVVDDPDEPGAYDVEHIVVLDDWLDGIDGTPETAFARLIGDRTIQTTGGMDHGSMGDGMGEASTSVPSPGMAVAESDLFGGHAGDVAHPLHLLNGRPPADRPTFDAPAGGRVRLRLINAASDTAYRFAIGGHRLTVTHADGFPVEAVEVDSLLLGMGERFDVMVQPQAGAYPIVALAEGKGLHAAAVLRTTAAASPPPVELMPPELDGRLLRYDDLRPLDAVRLAAGEPDVDVMLDLTGDDSAYRWGIDGRKFDDHEPVEVEEGQRVRLTLRNSSTMWHPMHLHGHTFALDDGGARKDTVIVLPGEDVSFSFQADNPGQWMLHCHNTYHLEAGMATVLSYVR